MSADTPYFSLFLSESCGPKQEEFLARCFYTAGQYDDPGSFTTLHNELSSKEAGRTANRIFYLSVPPSVFVAVAQNAARKASSPSGYTRVIVEKPFGRDLESSRALSRGLAEALTEEQTYRRVTQRGATGAHYGQMRSHACAFFCLLSLQHRPLFGQGAD